MYSGSVNQISNFIVSKTIDLLLSLAVCFMVLSKNWKLLGNLWKIDGQVLWKRALWMYCFISISIILNNSNSDRAFLLLCPKTKVSSLNLLIHTNYTVFLKIFDRWCIPNSNDRLFLPLLYKKHMHLFVYVIPILYTRLLVVKIWWFIRYWNHCSITVYRN